MRETPFLTFESIYQKLFSMHPSDRAENSEQNEWSHDSPRLSGEKL
jgi:hypothetical protein